jgi:hypothetical protein
MGGDGLGDGVEVKQSRWRGGERGEGVNSLGDGGGGTAFSATGQRLCRASTCHWSAAQRKHTSRLACLAVMSLHIQGWGLLQLWMWKFASICALTPLPLSLWPHPACSEHAAPELEVPAVVKVEVGVHMRTKPGQRLLLVGNHPSLGSWDLSRAWKLKWSDGHVWRGCLELPANIAGIEFKVSWLAYAFRGGGAGWRRRGGGGGRGGGAGT